MAKRKKSKISLKLLRNKLQWSQVEMADVLDISRGYYHNLENRLRPLSEDLEKKVAILQALSEVPVQTGDRDRNSYLRAKSALERRIGYLELHIMNLQTEAGYLQKMVADGVEHEARLMSQWGILKSIQAPMLMQNAVKSLALVKNVRRAHRDIHSLYLCEAKIAGRQSEVLHLRKRLEVILAHLE